MSDGGRLPRLLTYSRATRGQLTSLYPTPARSGARSVLPDPSRACYRRRRCSEMSFTVRPAGCMRLRLPGDRARCPELADPTRILPSGLAVSAVLNSIDANPPAATPRPCGPWRPAGSLLNPRQIGRAGSWAWRTSARAGRAAGPVGGTYRPDDDVCQASAPQLRPFASSNMFQPSVGRHRLLGPPWSIRRFT